MEHLSGNLLKALEEQRPLFSAKESEEVEKIRAILKQYPQDCFEVTGPRP